jgi:hypothetical protein
MDFQSILKYKNRLTNRSSRPRYRSAAELYRWAGAVESLRRAGVVQPGLFVGREGVAVSPWVGQGCCGQVTA